LKKKILKKSRKMLDKKLAFDILQSTNTKNQEEKIMTTRQDVIRYAIGDALNTRDFCGNEKNAIIDCFDDYDMKRPTKQELAYILNEVDKAWAKSQEMAGVVGHKVISDVERPQIEKVLK
jgi:hypothetical protein